MEHPFLNTDEIAEMDLDDIQEKIAELMQKLNVAYNVGNNNLIHQIHMALDSYNVGLNKKLMNMGTTEKYTDKIDIK